MFTDNKSQKYGTLWTRDELILAFDLYCRIPFRKTKSNNPKVIEHARLIDRSPASVARKLGNFGSFDPELHKKNVTGLAHASKLDNEIWDEFSSNWNQLVLEAMKLKNNFSSSVGQIELDEDDDAKILFKNGASEKETIRKTRLHQAFFRESVLSSYEETCCITGLRVKECLVASHIIPWSISEQLRTDPRNGLCLSATFDRLFDRGLVTLTNDYNIVVSMSLQKSDDKVIESMICKYHGSPIVRPRRFMPNTQHLEWHRENIFID